MKPLATTAANGNFLSPGPRPDAAGFLFAGPGADLVWVSAIVHQNSPTRNRALFRKVLQALMPGGRIAIRDIVMNKDHTCPAVGALFAVNMLVATEGGGTFTFEELREDLEQAGFIRAGVVRQDEGMNSIVVATKPGLLPPKARTLSGRTPSQRI